MIGELASKNVKSSLVVDCRGILRVGDHAFDAIIQRVGEKAVSVIKGARRSVLFWIPEELDREFETALKHASATYAEGDGLLHVYGPALDRTRAFEELNRARSLLDQNVQIWVGGCFRPWNELRRLPSTPLLSNGYFDSRRILAEPNRFQWTCVALRDIVNSMLPGYEASEGNKVDMQDIFLRSNVSLLAVSLRASAFAAGVAGLLGDYFVRTLSVVDHAGPRKRIFDRAMLDEISDGRNFILVSDFIIGGSELRAAEVLAEYRGGQILGAVCLGTALPPEEYNSLCAIESLALLPSCVKEFKCTFLP
ncbi:MAG TPA: hypothetical protein VNM67_00010 [Thermoanaerobaculia bacterium]|nr:hypothetical protein [Thermoanaerobaculia bacterium]